MAFTDRSTPGQEELKSNQHQTRKQLIYELVAVCLASAEQFLEDKNS
jgi:hypothetical protein